MKQFIICHNCGAIELAEIKETKEDKPFWGNTHECLDCGYWIDEFVPAKAISIRQPWANLIVSGMKYIENRTWKLPEKYKGKRVLIHVGLAKVEFNFTLDQINRLDYLNLRRWWYDKDFSKGAIIGSVEIVDCVINHSSIWAEKTEVKYLTTEKGREYKPIYNWILKDPIMFEKPILNVKGKLSFFIPEIND